MRGWAGAMSELRVGLGFDVHPRAVDRALWLGGVPFEGEEGLAGHSDGDAVCHALADALLGAAALGDVGEHFPEDDPTIAGIAGLDLLRRAAALVLGAGLAPVSCDLTVICERPAIAPRRDRLRESISGGLGLPVERVSVKATRPEGLGLSGDGVGCLAIAVVR
jgi:2-C-methyl-D-erythritol 2,4-cyclodiphosphate synthase